MTTAEPTRSVPVLRRAPLRRVARGLLIAMPVSFVLHTLMGGLLMGLTVWHSCMPLYGSAGGQGGENGAQGSGGRSVDITVEGPVTGEVGPQTAGQRDPPSTPSTPAPSEPQPPAPTASTHASRSARTLVAHHADDPATHHANDEHGTDTVAAAPTQQPASNAGNAAPRAHGGGTGSTVTNGGLRPGSVGQQRALLPAAVRCGDPVAGVWRAHKYDPMWGDWFRVTLRIEREPNNQLRGVIVARMWDGGPADARPPACGPDGWDFTVEQRAHGAQRGWYVEFGANSYVLREMHCNGLGRIFGYNPDHFSGTIDPEIQEFQSVNNDGGRAVNDPMVFRRIRCLADDTPSDPDTATPASPGESAPGAGGDEGGTPGGESPRPATRSPWDALPWRPHSTQ